MYSYLQPPPHQAFAAITFSAHTATSLVHIATIPSSASSAPLDHQRVSLLWPTSRVASEQLIRCLAQDEEDWLSVAVH